MMFAFQGRQIPDIYDLHALQIMPPGEGWVICMLLSCISWAGPVRNRFCTKNHYLVGYEQIRYLLISYDYPCLSGKPDPSCTGSVWPILCFFPGVFLSSRVTEACHVTTNLIMRVNVRTTTTTTTPTTYKVPAGSRMISQKSSTCLLGWIYLCAACTNLAQQCLITTGKYTPGMIYMI